MEMILKNVDNRKSPKTIIGHKYTMFLDISSRHNFLFFKLKEARNTNYPNRMLANLLFFFYTLPSSHQTHSHFCHILKLKKEKKICLVYMAASN